MNSQDYVNELFNLRHVGIVTGASRIGDDRPGAT